MKRRRSRLTLLGVLALAVCVTVGLAGGADAAKKKGKKKGVKQITVSKTTPTDIPPAPNDDQDSLTSIPLTVGKKAKGKVVSGNSVKATVTVSDPNFTGTDGDTGHVGLVVQSPSGRQVFLSQPDDHNIGTLGPITFSPDAATFACVPDTPPPPPPCSNPEATLGPPYAGTVGEYDLAIFTGVTARGTWNFRVFNDDPTQGVVINSVSLNIGLQSVPKEPKAPKKK
jgi:hypothetical protein